MYLLYYKLKYPVFGFFLAWSFFVQAQEDSLQIISLLDKGYEQEGENPQKAIETYRTAFEKSIQSHYYKEAFNALHYIGIVQSDLGRYDSAIYYYKKAEPYAKKASYERGEAMTFSNLGNVYQFTGQYDKAISHYLQGIKLFEKIKDSVALTLGYHNLSALYDNTYNNDNTELNYLKLALRFVGDNLSEKSLLYNDIGKNFIKKSNRDSAFYYLSEAEKIATEIDDPKARYFNNKNFGEYYRFIKQPEKAIAHYQNALNETEFYKDTYQKIDLGNFWAIGTKEKNNGLLIVLSMNERNIGISTGKGTENALSDEFLKKIIDTEIIPLFKQEKFYEGIMSGLNKIMEQWNKSSF